MADGPPLTRSVRLTSAQASKSDLLDFPAWSAQVYSNANQWLHFVGTNQFVGPGQQGAVVGLPGFTEFAIEWAAPPGTPQPPSAPMTEVNIIFYSVWMPPQPGGSSSVQSVPKPYDGQAAHSPAISLQATCTLSGVTGRRWCCTTITGSLTCGVAGGGGVAGLQLLDGPSGSPNILWPTVLGAQGAVGAMGLVFLSGLAYFGTVSTDMTLEFGAAQVNFHERVTFAAYLV